MNGICSNCRGENIDLRTLDTGEQLCARCFFARVKTLAADWDVNLDTGVITIYPPELWITAGDYADWNRDLLNQHAVYFSQPDPDERPHTMAVLAAQRTDDGLYLWLSNGFGWPTLENRVKVDPGERLALAPSPLRLPTHWRISGSDDALEITAEVATREDTLSGAVLVHLRKWFGATEYEAKVNWSAWGDQEPVIAERFANALELAAALASNVKGYLNRRQVEIAGPGEDLVYVPRQR